MRGKFGGGGGNQAPPVREGEELDVAIEAVGEKGDGIAKKQGFVIFVPNTKQGQNVRIKVTKVLRKVAFAEMIGDAVAAPVSESRNNDSNEESDSEEEASEEETEESADDTEDF
jgi:predicted RNA-binding protein with TRAM domain